VVRRGSEQCGFLPALSDETEMPVFSLLTTEVREFGIRIDPASGPLVHRTYTDQAFVCFCDSVCVRTYWVNPGCSQKPAWLFFSKPTRPIL
jgi:hypothetical protein